MINTNTLTIKLNSDDIIFIHLAVKTKQNKPQILR